jgi:uncharacterized protein YggE
LSPIRIAPFALALLASPAAAAEIQIASQGPVIELTVTEMADAKPDVAQVSAGVTTRAMTANEAARLNAQRMDRVIAKLRELGVPRDDIQTANFNLNAQWNHRPGSQPPVFAGYDVANQVNVKLRDMAQIGTVLDALIAAGANSVDGPNFMIENDRVPKAAARKAAFAGADVRGRELAALAGYRGVRLLEVSETFTNLRSRVANDAVMAVSAEAVGKATHIEPGQVGVAATLTVKYEMVR